jgi:glycine cleavage system transcriptional repressor
MSLLAVTAVGADRPGIIARVTRVLLDAEGNLEDSSMTILGGQFAIVLLVETDADPAQLQSALADATADIGLFVSVQPVGHGSDSAPPSHILTVYGTDRPGIVHAAAETLADLDVNVTDLTTRVLEGEQPVYAMHVEVSLPAATSQEALLSALRASMGEGVEVSVEALDTATL